MIPMQDTSGFYRVRDKKLDFGRDIITKQYELYHAKAHEYVYPVDGWIFFYSHAEAVSYYQRRSEL